MRFPKVAVEARAQPRPEAGAIRRVRVLFEASNFQGPRAPPPRPGDVGGRARGGQRRAGGGAARCQLAAVGRHLPARGAGGCPHLPWPLPNELRECSWAFSKRSPMGAPVGGARAWRAAGLVRVGACVGEPVRGTWVGDPVRAPQRRRWLASRWGPPPCCLLRRKCSRAGSPSSAEAESAGPRQGGLPGRPDRGGRGWVCAPGRGCCGWRSPLPDENR